MSRELPRTLYTLQTPYQQSMDSGEIEIIVVDNGSTQATTIPEDIEGIRLVHHPNPNQSPASAVNIGIKASRSDFIGVLVDGARMASPGLCHFALKADAISDRAVVSTLAYHLGPEMQMDSVPKGYCQSVEDALLRTISWQSNGYRLYGISTFAGSCAKGFLNPISESNALFMRRHLWAEIGGFDERFTSIGGGFVNLEAYRRACELPDSELIILTTEATFHQVHGGIATNRKREGPNSPETYHNEYERIRGDKLRISKRPAIYLGGYRPEVHHIWNASVENARGLPDRSPYARLNDILRQHTRCKPFRTHQ